MSEMCSLRAKSWSPPARTARALVLLLGLGGLGCVDEDEVAPGAPVLESLTVVDAMGATVALDADAGPVLIPPRATFLALFDRLLDPGNVAVAGDGGLNAAPGVVTLEAPGAPAASVVYTPNGSATNHLLFAPGPTLQITPSPTLPSGATVKVTLALAQILAKDKKTAAVLGPGATASLTVQTAPFAATVTLPPADADGGATAATPDFVSGVTFDNLPAADTKDHITVTAAGVSVADVAASDMDPTSFTITPKGGAWPAGAHVTVTVDADAKDLLGVKIAQATTASFDVGAATP